MLLSKFPFAFLLNSKRIVLFHCIAYGYSHADWYGVRDHLRDPTWEDIFKACSRYFSLFLKDMYSLHLK